MTSQQRSPETTNDTYNVFLRSDALAAGLTDRQLKTSAYRRILHGVYAPSEVPLTHQLKCAAASLTLPKDAVITGLSAATLRGVPLADFAAPVEVVVPREHGMLRRQGLRCTAVRTYDFESSSWHGVRVAGFARIAFDILKRRSVGQAVAYCDALLHAGAIRVDEIAGFLVGRRDDGVVRARQRLQYLDERSESVPESVLRVEFALRGLHPVPQVEVFDQGRFVARVDLAFEAERVAVEYDGGWHADPAQIQRDTLRRNSLRALGWIVIVVTSNQLRDELEAVVSKVRSTLELRRTAISMEISSPVSIEIARGR